MTGWGAWRPGAGIVFAALVLGLAGCKTAPPSTPRTYLVFFHSDSADLSPEARQVVDQAAAGVTAFKPSTVAVASFADKVGTPAYNQHLSERRVAAVEQALVADGVSPGLLLRVPLAEAEAANQGTGDRRVEIRLSTLPAS